MAHENTTNALCDASEKLWVTLLVPVYHLFYTVYLIAATRTKINSFTNAR
jgi:hypothetical protein